MVGRIFERRRVYRMERKTLFISCLKESILCAEKECSVITQGGDSKWSHDHLQNIVLPELNILLSHAINGIVFFRYGKKQRILESTYLLIDSFQDRRTTDLGKKLSELQKIYNSL